MTRLRQAGQGLVEHLLQFGNIGVIAFALGLRQQSELSVVQPLAVTHRGEGQRGTVAVQHDIALQRLTLDDLDGAVVTPVEALVDGVLALLEGRVLEGRRKGRQQVVDQLLDIVNQLRGGPGSQMQRSGLP